MSHVHHLTAGAIPTLLVLMDQRIARRWVGVQRADPLVAALEEAGA